VDWSNERYVRIYTRNTADLLAVGWEGRLVWYELLRHSDRAGVIDTGGDVDCLPEMLRVPHDVFAVGFDRILKRPHPMVEVHATAVVIPNFEDAQEARQSDAHRAKESRERRKQRARLKTLGVTERTETSQNVTAEVGFRDEPSLPNDVRTKNVTLCCAVPCCAVPSVGSDPEAAASEQPPPKAKRSKKANGVLEKHRAEAERLWQIQTELRQNAIPGSRPLAPNDERLTRIAERLEAGATPADCETVLEHYADRARRDPGQRQWFNGTTNWRRENFETALGMVGSGFVGTNGKHPKPLPIEHLRKEIWR
jgi:hypothetical protein